MYRTLIFLLVTGLVTAVAGCSGEGNSNQQNAAGNTETAASHTVENTPEQPSRSMIPQPLDVVEGVELNVYFDQAGTVTEKAVGDGDVFSCFIIAEYKDPFHINAAQYRLEVPDGIKVVGETKHNDRVLTIGSWDTDFSIAFQCEPPGKMYLMKYNCVAEPGFTGGKIRVTQGINPAGQPFLGFVSCKPQTEKLPAKGGSANLAKK
jgi:hypothetical protein